MYRIVVLIYCWLCTFGPLVANGIHTPAPGNYNFIPQRQGNSRTLLAGFPSSCISNPACGNPQLTHLDNICISNSIFGSDLCWALSLPSWRLFSLFECSKGLIRWQKPQKCSLGRDMFQVWCVCMCCFCWYTLLKPWSVFRFQLERVEVAFSGCVSLVHIIMSRCASCS